MHEVICYYSKPFRHSTIILSIYTISRRECHFHRATFLAKHLHSGGEIRQWCDLQVGTERVGPEYMAKQPIHSPKRSLNLPMMEILRQDRQEYWNLSCGEPRYLQSKRGSCN